MIHPRPRSPFALLAVFAAALAGCSGGNPVAPPPAEADLVASKLSVLAITVATAPEGRGFFDNFLPCPRRGVVNYYNTPAGRHATFSGCELGDGVTVDGSAEIRWTGSGLSAARNEITTLELNGDMAVQVENMGMLDVKRMRVEGIRLSDPLEPAPEPLDLSALRVTLFGESYRVDERGNHERLFEPELNIRSIPNPSNSLDALSEADMKRIAYHLGMDLAELLFLESLEAQRGEHTHETECGTVRVLPDPANQAVRLQNTFNTCALEGGLFVDGSFTQEWTQIDLQDGELGMVVQGPFTVGGGVPTLTLTRMEWTISGVADLPANARISGMIATEAGERPFSFQLTLDD